MLTHYALDFGTTNTVIASDRDGAVNVLPLRDLTAERVRTPVVPSAVCFNEDGSAPIGQLAVSQNFQGRLPNFAQGFKRHLGRESRRAVARLGGTDISARRAAEAFFDGLRAALRQQFRPRRSGLLGWWDDFNERRRPLLSDLTLTAPVDADELYRMELSQLGRRIGARTLRLIDEPVAAALGYGVNVGRELTVLVFDWGGGTLDVSIVRTGPKTLAEGRAEVLAKSDAPLGGDDIDRWIVERFLHPVERYVKEWEMDALWEATRVKETASIHGEAAFRFRDTPARPFTRDDLRALLRERGAYDAMERALTQALEQLSSRHGLGVDAIDEALLVGGSSLLPEVDERLRRALPSARVGEWNPFAAVATGACEFARGGQVVDQIYHDYALRMADDAGKAVYYELIVPAATRYPTDREFAERVYAPDPGSPHEMLFEICEIRRLGLAPVAWEGDAPAEPSSAGASPSRLGGGRRVWRPTAAPDHQRALVINEGQTALRLPPSRRNPRRLRVTYRVDSDRYLRWTVRDGEGMLKNDEVLGRLR
jgi:molecular chaperone DnaK (HSP70)